MRCGAPTLPVGLYHQVAKSWPLFCPSCAEIARREVQAAPDDYRDPILDETGDTDAPTQITQEVFQPFQRLPRRFRLHGHMKANGLLARMKRLFDDATRERLEGLRICVNYGIHSDYPGSLSDAYQIEEAPGGVLRQAERIARDAFAKGDDAA